MSVVAFKPKTMIATPTASQPVLENKWLHLIILGLQKKVREGTRMYEIANSTNLCQATISNLLCGKTKYPRMDTIVRIMKYLGYKLYAQK